MLDMILPIVGFEKEPWNKGRLIGQKRPLRPKDVWSIRVRLQLKGRKRDLALFNLAITASYAAAILSRCRSMTYALAAGCATAGP